MYVNRSPVADAFTGGICQIPVNPVIGAVVSALCRAGANSQRLSGGWTVGADGMPNYLHLGRKGGSIRISFEADQSEASEWAPVESTNQLTLDVALTVLAHLCAPSHRDRTKYPLLTAIPVSATAIMKARNVVRWGDDRVVLEARIAAEVQRLARLRIDVQDYFGWDSERQRWAPRGLSVEADRLFEIVEEGTEADGSHRWSVRFGQWARWWMNAQGTVWVCELPQRLLGLDARINRSAAALAKKIGINLVLLWGAVRKRPRVERRIDHLLEDIGELPLPMYRNGHWAGRTRDRFDDAILTLEETGIVGGVEWPGQHSPGGSDRNKGWVQSWMGSRIIMLRPGLASPASTKSERMRTRPMGAPATTFRGVQVRSARIERNMSQAQLARSLGVTPTYLSLIENGRRPMPNWLCAEILAWQD